MQCLSIDEFNKAQIVLCNQLLLNNGFGLLLIKKDIMSETIMELIIGEISEFGYLI